jgi:hypothetical protein
MIVAGLVLLLTALSLGANHLMGRHETPEEADAEQIAAIVAAQQVSPK